MFSELKSYVNEIKKNINLFRVDFPKHLFLSKLEEEVNNIDNEIIELESFIEEYEEYQDTFIGMNGDVFLKVLTLNYFNVLYNEDLNIGNLCMQLMYNKSMGITPID